MGTVEYKNRIKKELDLMDKENLKQAWLILKEISSSNKKPDITDKKKIEAQLSNGIKQLNKGEGTDFSAFIGSMKKKYGKG
jgi:hypothetical protein